MKVLDLQCQHHHSFEGWFGSEDDFQSQNARLLVECPFCGDHQITKMLSAPRLNLSGASLIAAAFEEVDSTPMEGFDPKSVDDILGLGAKGLRSVALMPLGYRLKGQDWLETLKKIRRPVSEFVTEVK